MEERLRYNRELSSIPLRGSFPLRSDDDPVEDQPQLVVDGKSEVLTIPDQIDRYQEILSLVANGRGKFGYCDFQYDEGQKNWKILLSWTEWYKESPQSARHKKLGLG